jgi:hypothetical protein
MSERASSVALTPRRTFSTLRSALFWDINLRWVAVLYRCFGTTGPIFKGQVQEDGTERLSETSVQNYHSKLRNILEERRSPLVVGSSCWVYVVMWCVLALLWMLAGWVNRVWPLRESGERCSRRSWSILRQHRATLVWMDWSHRIPANCRHSSRV